MTGRALTALGGAVLLVAPADTQAQLLRGTLDPTGTVVAPGGGSTGTGVAGTGLTVGTTGVGTGVLGTGLTVGTAPAGNGVLGTGLTVGTTGPGGGLLGTGLTLGTMGGSGPGTPCGGCGSGQPGGPGAGGSTGGSITLSQSQSLVNELRLSNAASALAANNTSALASASATGADTLSVGYGASASGGTSVAVGAGASAAGTGSVAVGAGASAGQSNTVAIGAGARTTRDNQVVIGGAANTYTLSGITSAASAAAQSGPTQFVTTDAAGNLAASPYGPAGVAALGNRVGAVEQRVDTLEAKTAALARYATETRREARQGVATALAMSTASMPSAPGRTTWVANSAAYRGEWAGGFAVAHRLPTCCVPVAVTAGFAYGGNNTAGVRAGLAGEF